MLGRIKLSHQICEDPRESLGTGFISILKLEEGPCVNLGATLTWGSGEKLIVVRLINQEFRAKF